MGKDIDPQIGIRLAEIRRRRGLTQRQLATAIGVTLTSLQNYERGRNAITGRRLDALASALFCKPIDLLIQPGEEPGDSR
jgi:transcriptional regulator with XRE-family HTH domain